MKRPLAFAIVLAVVLMASLVAVVLAGTQYAPNAPCVVGDSTQILLAENTIHDTSDGDDILVACNNIQRLSDIVHTLPGNCHTSALGGGTTWNNCVDSFYALIPSVDILCFYDSASYGTTPNVVGYDSSWSQEWVDLPQTYLHDRLTSFRWVYVGTGGSSWSCPMT